MARQGGCLCGAVRYELADDPREMGACHCGMCRKFSGGVNLAFEVPPGGMTFLKDDGLATYASSAWAERAFCRTCGSSLFYRMTAPGPMQGQCYVGLGSLDDANGIPMKGEIFIDRKPDGYAFAGEMETMTEAQFMEIYAQPQAG